MACQRSVRQQLALTFAERLKNKFCMDGIPPFCVLQRPKQQHVVANAQETASTHLAEHLKNISGIDGMQRLKQQHAAETAQKAAITHLAERTGLLYDGLVVARRSLKQ